MAKLFYALVERILLWIEERPAFEVGDWDYTYAKMIATHGPM